MLNVSAYADYATYLNDFRHHDGRQWGAPWSHPRGSEQSPDIVVTYESCSWTAAQMLAFCHTNAGAITATKVIMPESYQFQHAMSDLEASSDPTASANIDLIGGHLYGGGLMPYPLAVAKGKEVWMTEHLDTSTDWPGALGTAKEIHDCLVTGNFSAYLWWYIKRYLWAAGRRRRLDPAGLRDGAVLQIHPSRILSKRSVRRQLPRPTSMSRPSPAISS